MKKLAWIIPVLIVLAMFMTACSVTNDSTTSSTSDKFVEDQIPTPVNYMDEIKTEIHDELFREASEETLDIIDRIFKHLEIDTISSSVDGNNAFVLMNITTVNAGKAWVVGMERYAIACAENLFAENYDDDATLYSYYLDEFESCVRHADYITMPITVEMNYHNHRWEWDLDDDVVNAITGQLLAAIEGDINSNTKWYDETPENNDIIMEDESAPSEDNSTDVSVTTGMEAAAKRAEIYMDYLNYSRTELKDALKDNGFSSAEIEYALKSVGY